MNTKINEKFHDAIKKKNLQEAGADWALKNNDGETPLGLSDKNGNRHLFDLAIRKKEEKR